MGRLSYLENYQSTKTVETYKDSLRSFFETFYGEEGSLEELAERYFNEKRKYAEDLQKFQAALKEYAPKTIRLRISAVKTFLMENNVELKQQFWRKLRGGVKGSRALTLDRVPSNEQLRKTMMHLPVQGKAFFLALCSSGMRIGEALKLQVEDVDLNVDPSRIQIRGEYTKTGNSRISFISREAAEAINEWLKVRIEYLESSSARSRYDKPTKDLRLFPFSGDNARYTWNTALKKTGNGKKDNQTGYRVYHPHVLRKFFRTQLGKVIPVDVVEALMGREGYLTEVYRRYSVEDLAKFYKKGEHALLVFTEAEEVGKLRKEVEERNKHLQILVNGLSAENMTLRARMKQYEQKLSKIEKILENVKRDLEK